MNTVKVVRARCIYSKVTLFDVYKYYDFKKVVDRPSFSIYKAVGVEFGYASRLLDECGVLVIESGCEVLAVFEVL